MKRVLTILAATAALFAACGGTAAASSINHVVLIVEENHSQSAVTGHMPYLESLGRTYARTTNLQAIRHPSLPNYFALTAGATFVSSDCGSSTSGCRQKADNIYHQQGSSWAQWSESMKTNCQSQNSRPYVVHHAPAPFFTDLDATCKAKDIPLREDNIPALTARFTFITPNLNHDAHDGTLGQADGWLRTVVPQLMNTTAYKSGSTLIEVTFDEGSGGNQTVYTAFVNPSLHGVVVSKRATHYSTLRLNEELLGDPLLAGARSAPDIRSALGL